MRPPAWESCGAGSQGQWRLLAIYLQSVQSLRTPRLVVGFLKETNATALHVTNRDTLRSSRVRLRSHLDFVLFAEVDTRRLAVGGDESIALSCALMHDAQLPEATESNDTVLDWRMSRQIGAQTERVGSPIECAKALKHADRPSGVEAARAHEQETERIGFVLFVLRVGAFQ